MKLLAMVALVAATTSTAHANEPVELAESQIAEVSEALQEAAFQAGAIRDSVVLVRHGATQSATGLISVCGHFHAQKYSGWGIENALFFGSFRETGFEMRGIGNLHSEREPIQSKCELFGMKDFR